MEARKYVAYLRVSTKRQGDSGLGLEAQRRSVEAAVGKENVEREFIEMESGRGKGERRPQLMAALAHCKQTGSVLVIARLDRLSRNVSCLFALREAGVEFRALDLPELSTVSLALFGAFAQRESELISSRTKAALQEKKRRIGGKLHNNLTPERRQLAYDRRRSDARENPVNVRAYSFARTLISAGETYRAVVGRMNECGLETPRGARWHLRSLQNLLSLYKEDGENGRKSV
jgi:DNA invertase Pin-like site-specific DNA recombinase